MTTWSLPGRGGTTMTRYFSLTRPDSTRLPDPVPARISKKRRLPINRG